jgi:hypothetical protein
MLMAQGFPDQNINWKQIEANIGKGEKLNYLNKISFNKYFNFEYSDLASEVDSFHFVDLNGDNLIDIVYEGKNPPGIEGVNFAFLVNQGDSFKLALKMFGYIESINFISGKVSKMQLIWPPCCANYVFFRNFYSFQNGSLKLEQAPDSLFDSQYNQYYSNFFTVYIDSSEALGYCEDIPKKVESVSGKTKKEAFITFDRNPVTNKSVPPDDAAYDVYYPAEGNNQVALLKPDTKLTVLSTSTIESGKKYHFIKAKNKNCSQSIFRDYNNLIIYGWTESENIEIAK